MHRQMNPESWRQGAFGRNNSTQDFSLFYGSDLGGGQCIKHLSTKKIEILLFRVLCLRFISSKYLSDSVQMFCQDNRILQYILSSQIRLDVDGIRISMFFPSVDVIKFFPLFLIPLMTKYRHKQEFKVSSLCIILQPHLLINAFFAFSINSLCLQPFYRFFQCVTSVKVGSKCIPRYF